jgi:serine/threonine protein kinase
MAPELLRNRDYDYTVDLWSMGVLLYEMLHGSSPFKGKTDADTMGNILQCNVVYRDGISEEAKCMMRSLLQKAPQQRIKWKDVFEHKWVQKYERQFENNRFPFNENDFQEFSIKDYVNPDCAIRLPYHNSFSTLTNVINKKKNSAKFTSNSSILHATISPENKKLFVGFKSQSKLSINNEKYKRSQFTNLTNGPIYQAKSLESSLCAMNGIRVHTPAIAKQQSLWEKIKSFMFN